MNPFDAQLAADLDFMNSAEFADSDPIIYVAADNSELAFNAVIQRDPPMIVRETGEKFAPSAKFWIPSSLLNRKPDKNGDRVRYPTLAGDDPSEHVIVDIISSDGGGWYVRCR